MNYRSTTGAAFLLSLALSLSAAGTAPALAGPIPLVPADFIIQGAVTLPSSAFIHEGVVVFTYWLCPGGGLGLTGYCEMPVTLTHTATGYTFSTGTFTLPVDPLSDPQPSFDMSFVGNYQDTSTGDNGVATLIAESGSLATGGAILSNPNPGQNGPTFNSVFNPGGSGTIDESTIQNELDNVPPLFVCVSCNGIPTPDQATTDLLLMGQDNPGMFAYSGDSSTLWGFSGGHILGGGSATESVNGQQLNAPEPASGGILASALLAFLPIARRHRRRG